MILCSLQTRSSSPFLSLSSVKPRFNDFRYNDIPSITINNCNRLLSKSYNEMYMYGAEPRYNDLRYSDILGLTMGMSLTERKIFPVITIQINITDHKKH